MKKKPDLWIDFYPTLKKLLMELKIAFIIIVVSVTNVLAAPVYSQVAKVSLDVNNMSLEKVIDDIEKQTEFYFVFNQKQIDVNRDVTIQAENKLITDILPELFNGTNVNYLIFDKKILLTTDPIGSNIKTAAMESQQKQITGTVTDAATGEPLPGVNVLIEGTLIGAVTDVDGKFTIQQPEQNAVLSFSFISYVTQKINYTGQLVIEVKLATDIKSLDEVVVVGYGVQKKSNVTGAIASVKGEDLKNRSANNVGVALQGKISGVQVLTRSGAPGSGAEFRIRGYSNNASSEPLYIVDGLKVQNINYLDPNSISSIEVLKDAASAAIYGAEAGNGVVLISTKKGSSGTSRLFFSSLYTIQKQSNKLKMQNAQEFKDYWMGDGIPEASFQNGNTDWNKVVFEDGKMQAYTLGVEGGNDKSTFYAALTYNDDNGMVVGNNDINRRLAAQINADYNIKPWLKIGSNNSIERGKTVTVSANNFTGTGSVIGGGFFYDPTVPLYYQDDAEYQAIDPTNNLQLISAEANGFNVLRNSQRQLYGSSFLMQSNLWHPLGMIENYKNEAWRTNINGSAYAEFKPIKGMVYTSRLGYRFGNTFSSDYTTGYWWNVNQHTPSGALTAELTHSVYYAWENFINYSYTLGKNNLAAMAGMSYTNSNNTNLYARTTTLESDAPNYRYIEYSAASANDDINGRNYDQRNISYFGRLEWNYDNKYMLQGSIRGDAYDASKLSTDNRWGYFPSVSAGWVLTDEDFIKNLGFTPLSYFKVRASWGINGNVNVLRDYPYSSTLTLGGEGNYYSFTNQLYTAAAPSNRLPNPDVTWERSKQTDIGFESRFLNSRLTFGMDYFHKMTDGLLINDASAPVVSGTNVVRKNVGKILNRGVEFELSWRDKIGDFTYSFSGNLSTLHNEVVASPYGEGRYAGGGAFVNQATYFETGQPIWYLRGYVLDHIDEANGQPIWKTAEQLGTTDGMAPLGSAIPDFTYGATLNAAYKSFDLRVFGSGQQGSELLFGVVRADLARMNMPDFLVEDYWTPTNTVAKNPGANGFRSSSRQIAQSDMVVFNSSYFRIKEIQLGYTLPSKISNMVKISNLRIYASLENFFTITKYKGLNPESMASTQAGDELFPGFRLSGGMGIDLVQYPAMKQVLFGLNVSF
jgi:TonB-linked SusC/RagA family outer membrane protein